MVAPVTGPYTNNESFGVKGFHWRTWYRQKQPYDLRLPRSMRKAWIMENTDGACNAGSWSWDPLTWGLNNTVLAKARERFRNDIGQSAQLSTTIAEYRTSLSMITQRVLQIARFAHALRQGNLVRAASLLKLDPSARRPRTGIRRGKSFGNAFLEWHFGWSPLVNDIGNAVDVLQAPLPSLTAKGSGKASTFSDTLTQTWYHGKPLYGGTRRELTVRCKLQAEVTVTNHNLYLANALGFTNPASIAWELVPFSFVVDWFIPVGNFLSQWTDFVGLSLGNATTTYYGDGNDWVRQYGHPEFSTFSRRKGIVRIERTYGIPSFALRPNQVTGLSPMRGVTAVSLLLQRLRG